MKNIDSDPVGFVVEYAKSSRSTCRFCDKKIMQDSLRVGIETKSTNHDGTDTCWVHDKCFKKEQGKTSYVKKIGEFKGWDFLRWDDQVYLRGLVGDDSCSPENVAKDEKLAEIRDKNIKIFELVGKLKSGLKAPVIKQSVADNGISFEKGGHADLLLYLLADGLLFGKPGPCPECGGAHVYYHSSGVYVCHGWISGYTRCSWWSDECKRYCWKLTDGVKSSAFFESWKFPKGYPKEEYPKVKPGGSAGGGIAESGDNSTESKKEKKRKAASDDGNDAGELAKKKSKLEIKKAKQPVGGSEILRIDPDYFGSEEEDDESGSSSSSDSDSDSDSGKKKRKKRKSKKKSEQKKKKKAKKDAVSKSARILVERDSVYGWVVYNALLNTTDISTGVNKYYKMQVIQEGPRSPLFTFWIHWGRTGTDVGGQRAYTGLSKTDAVGQFKDKFFDMTGNRWDERYAFEKKPRKYNLSELDDGNEDSDEKKKGKKKGEGGEKAKRCGDPTSANPSENGSAMCDRLRKLIALMFDKDMMYAQLKSMSVDVEKMPLGKISRKQIQSAYAILNALSEALQCTPVSRARLVDCSNRFYTLVPHNFGDDPPVVIDTVEMVNEKNDLLGVLCDLETANALMDAVDKSEEHDELRQCYESLHTRLTPLDPASEMYKLIERYAYTTQGGSKRDGHAFKIDDIFAVEREGELERYEPWAKDPNRALLWHCSRLSNFVGILSTGLRIAPPEAPVTGYRFGKGLYFADMTAKCWPYCRASRSAPEAIMLLNEVALGREFRTGWDKYMEKPQPGTDSTHAVGMTYPDPSEAVTLENGTKVPLGKGCKLGERTGCTHNEFIVYDVAQVTIRYLVKVTMN